MAIPKFYLDEMQIGKWGDKAWGDLIWGPLNLIMGLRARRRFGSHWGKKVPYFNPEGEEYRHPQNGGAVYRIRFRDQEAYLYVQGDNPRLEVQQGWREIQALGVAAAKALTPEERVPYEIRAKGKKLGSWFNVFLSDWLFFYGLPLWLWEDKIWGVRRWG